MRHISPARPAPTSASPTQKSPPGAKGRLGNNWLSPFMGYMVAEPHDIPCRSLSDRGMEVAVNVTRSHVKKRHLTGMAFFYRDGAADAAGWRRLHAPELPARPGRAQSGFQSGREPA